MSRSGHDLWMMEIGEDAGRLSEAEAILAEWDRYYAEQAAAGVFLPDAWGNWLAQRVSELRKGASE